MVRTRIEVQNGNDELSFDSGMVTIGGRTGVNVVLRDVMVADRHCVITYEDGFEVRDTGSVTGTWVNGERVSPSASLADGATIIIGTTKLQVSIEADDGTQVLQLKTDPQSFWWKKPGKGAFDNDPDQLAYAETKFGRFPALHLGNRIAMIAGGVVLLAATFVSSVMEPLADPGELIAPHALVTTIALDDPAVHAGIRTCVELSGAQGCNVCHETGNGAPESKCVQCHGLAGEMAAAGSFRHPYHNDGKVAPVPGAMDSEQFCVVCHTDHNESRWLKPIAKDLLGNCAACHDDGTGFDRDALIAKANVALPPAQPRAFDTYAFPHDQHLAKDIECIVCHRIDDAVLQDNQRGVPDNPLRHDFTTVEYEVCTSCHVKDAPPVNMTAAQQREWRAEGLIVTSSWHGTEDNGSHCMQCHASAERDGTTVFGPEMKAVDRGDFSTELYQRERANYQTGKRSHEEQFAAHANGQACTKCHLSGAISEVLQPASRTFWHGLHVANGALSPASGNEASVSLDGQAGCVSCHKDLAAASAASLTPAGSDGSGNYHWPETSEAQAACADCHNEAGTALRLTAVNNRTTATVRPVPDFPHGLHVGSASFGKSGTLQQGCFACHDFSEAAADAPFSQVPRTKPGASDCTNCHGGHDNIAGGDCQTCHPKIEGVSNSFLLQAKILTPPPATRQWPAPNGFSHLSTGHKDEGCATCHKETGIGEAETLQAVRVPDETAAVCRDCHLQKQFHWR